MKFKNLSLCVATVALSGFAYAQTMGDSFGITGVGNSAGYQTTLAPGSIFTVFGSGLGPEQLMQTTTLPYPTSLGGTTLTLTSATGGDPISIPLVYSSQSQVSALLPSNVGVGEYYATLTYAGQATSPFRVSVAPNSFGFFTANSSGGGTVQATYGGYNLNRYTSGTTNMDGRQWTYRPAVAGDVITLWGTGLGADMMSDQNGQSGGDITNTANVRVIVGGVEVTPTYAGRAPGLPGVDQINFRLPSNITTGCTVPIQVRVGNQPMMGDDGFNTNMSNMSNLGWIAIAEQGQTSCQAPYLTQEQLRNLDAGGTLYGANWHLFQITAPTNTNGQNVWAIRESLRGGFFNYRNDQIGWASFNQTPNTCTNWRREGELEEVAFPLFGSGLEAGATVRLQGDAIAAQNAMVSTDRMGNSTYDLLLSTPGQSSNILMPGTYTLTGTGGTQVGPFNANVSFPQTPFVWTNADDVNLSRSSGQEITWTGGSSTDLVEITGFASRTIGGPAAEPTVNAIGFTCTAPANASSFVIPASVLNPLPEVSNNVISGRFGTLYVTLRSNPTSNAITAPLVSGGQSTFGNFGYTIGTRRYVGFH